MTVRRIALCVAMAAAIPALTNAQSEPTVTVPSPLDVLAGSELENYLRALQVAGFVEPYPWSVRGFSARELSMLLQTDSGTGAWAVTAQRLGNGLAPGGLSLRAVFNSAYPYGANDGAVWAGRGFTVSASAGATLRAGPLSLSVAPVAYVAQNTAFPLLDNGQEGPLAFNDGLFARRVDRPQRFGPDAHGRIDPGASGLRIDTRLVTAGAGTFPMWWGPSVENPFVLGTNAAGIPHLFIGSGEPLNIGIGRVHMRVVWGRLDQSEYSPVTGGATYVSNASPGTIRLMGGFALTATPRPFPGLEVGIAHFSHVPYLGTFGRYFWRSPFPDVFLKKNLPGNVSNLSFAETKNQLASVFARWVFPSAGFELYGEHGHDDWYHDLRDLLQEPDHNKSYTIGLQKTLSRSGRVLSLVRGEIINYQMPQIARDRPGQGSIYSHTFLRQGHTHRGQLLGSAAGVGSAAASVVAYERYTPAAHSTISWRRNVRAERGDFSQTGIVDSRATDVLHSVGFQQSRTRGSLRVTYGVEIMRNFNRNFAEDVSNLSLSLTLARVARAAAGRMPPSPPTPGTQPGEEPEPGEPLLRTQRK